MNAKASEKPVTGEKDFAEGCCSQADCSVTEETLPVDADSTESATRFLAVKANAAAASLQAGGEVLEDAASSGPTEAKTRHPRAACTAPDRLRLVFDEQTQPLVSSRRKVTYRARYVGGRGSASTIPVVATFFTNRRAFDKEFEKLELANGLGVGPRVFDVCHREKPQVGSLDSSVDSAADGRGNRTSAGENNAASVPATPGNRSAENGAQSDCVPNDARAAFPCLIEEDLGVSLASMIGEGAAAPHGEAGRSGMRLAPIGSADRARQAAKIAFDIGAELALLHSHGAFYLDLKPSNVCVRAYGSNPADIRAGLIDFESLVTSSRPSDYSTLACHNTLCAWARAKGVDAPMLTNTVVDLGFLLLLTASTLCGKAISALTAANIDAASALPGMGFFAIRYGCFDVRPLDESDLAALAETAGVAHVQPETQALPHHIEAGLSTDAMPEPKPLGSATPDSPGKAAATQFKNATAAPSAQGAASPFEDGGGKPALGRFGFCDAVDKLRAAQNPLYVLAKRKFDIALACHGEWRNAAGAGRSDLIEDFFAQDPVKIKQGLRQAGGILDYVARLGCALVPEQLADLPRYRARRVKQLSCGQVLLIAQWEHESWRALHEQLGFRYAERNVDGTRPIGANEYLLTWANLCETPETDAAPQPAGAPPDAALAKLWDTRARNDIAFACGIVAKLQSIGLAVISETYHPPIR